MRCSGAWCEVPQTTHSTRCWSSITLDIDRRATHPYGQWHRHIKSTECNIVAVVAVRHGRIWTKPYISWQRQHWRTALQPGIFPGHTHLQAQACTKFSSSPVHCMASVCHRYSDTPQLHHIKPGHARSGNRRRLCTCIIIDGDTINTQCHSGVR